MTSGFVLTMMRSSAVRGGALGGEVAASCVIAAAESTAAPSPHPTCRLHHTTLKNHITPHVNSVDMTLMVSISGKNLCVPPFRPHKLHFFFEVAILTFWINPPSSNRAEQQLSEARGSYPNLNYHNKASCFLPRLGIVTCASLRYRSARLSPSLMPLTSCRPI